MMAQNHNTVPNISMVLGTGIHSSGQCCTGSKNQLTGTHWLIQGYTLSLKFSNTFKANSRDMNLQIAISLRNKVVSSGFIKMYYRGLKRWPSDYCYTTKLLCSIG